MKSLLSIPLLLLMCTSFLATTVFSQSQKYHRINATISNKVFQDLMQSGLEIDHYHFHDGVLSAEVSDNDIELLKQNNIKIKYIIKDIAKNINAYNRKIDKQVARNPLLRLVTVPTPANFGSGGTYGVTGAVARHFTFQEMQNELDDMRTLFPNLITVKSSIGTTDQGRSIFMVRISDNADADENEPEVYLNAVHHAREPISMTQLIFFMWHMLENYNSDKEIQTLINSSELYILPCVNPDGYVYNATNNPTGGGFWRKNRHNNGNGTFGVDNNRNYGFGWGGTGSSGTPSSETYRGTAPFSEAENIAIRDFVNSRNFVSEFNYHSYGNYCIYPYSYVAVNTNPEIPLFTQLSTFLTSDNGYVYGNSSATVNYIASGGAEDWAYGEQTTKGKMYGFTPETGASTDGFYPAASRIIPLCNSMIVMNKNLIKVSTKYCEVTSSPPSVITSLNGMVPISIQNFSIYPATYTVTLTPLSAFISGVDAAKIISSSTIFQTQNDLFNFTIDPATPSGTFLDFEVGTDNGYSVRRDAITIQYTCEATAGTSTTGITATSAFVNWGNANGATDYYLSSKLFSSPSWGADVLVSGNSTLLTGLIPNTSYNWRVRSINCSEYSVTQSFTTLEMCGTPSPTASSVSTYGFNLSWPAISNASSYDVQIRILGTIPWTTYTVTTNTKSVTGLMANTFYEYGVNATCPSGTGPYSATQNVTTSIYIPVAYCTSNGNITTSEWIDYIELASIARNSNNEPGGYINTGLTINLVRGTEYTLNYSAGFISKVFKEHWKVYIDYNSDGDFADANEIIVNKSNTGASNFTGTFRVPSNATLASTRMRVKMSRNSISSSCGSVSYGEVEDYNIIISGAAIDAYKFSSDEVMNESDELAIDVMPNPFDEQINITLKENFEQLTYISLIDINGKILFKQSISKDILEYQFNTSDLLRGVYIMLIQNGDRRKTFKMVK